MQLPPSHTPRYDGLRPQASHCNPTVTLHARPLLPRLLLVTKPCLVNLTSSFVEKAFSQCVPIKPVWEKDNNCWNQWLFQVVCHCWKFAKKNPFETGVLCVPSVRERGLLVVLLWFSSRPLSVKVKLSAYPSSSCSVTSHLRTQLVLFLLSIYLCVACITIY